MNNTLKNINTLQIEYETKLAQYNQAVQDFNAMVRKIHGETGVLQELSASGIDMKIQEGVLVGNKKVLNDSDVYKYKDNAKNHNDVLEIVPDATYWGTSGVGSSRARSAMHCKKKCMKSSSCTGATFIPRNRFCYLRSGTGDVKTGRNGHYAIVNTLMIKIQQLKGYNRRLLYINRQINDIIRQGGESTNLDGLMNENKETNDDLVQQHNRLLEQRNTIDGLIQGYDNVDEASTDTDLRATSSLMVYRFYVIVFVILLYIPVVMKYGSPGIYGLLFILTAIFWYFRMGNVSLALLFLLSIVFAYSVPLALRQT